MFSWTTTASSTTMPIARISPSMVMLLSVKPIASMNAKVAIIDVGMESVAMSVVRQSRMKSRIVRLTRTAARSRWVWTSWIEFSMNRDWSRMIWTSMSSGRMSRISSSRCLTRSTTATVLVPDCFCTIRLTARSPGRPAPRASASSAGPAVHRRLSPRGSSNESLTVPMSLMRIG